MIDGVAADRGRSGLVSGYDQVIFDLDGVLYLGEEPVVGAPGAVRMLREYPVDIAYATNNASRSSDAVAELLTSVGIPAAAEEVVTSARAAASLLAERYPAGSPVLVVGTAALAEDVRHAGLQPVRSAGDGPVAVVQGYAPDVGWAALAEASVAIRAGAGWIATNTDRTLPSPRGPLPGNGALVAALATALSRQPDDVVGKPAPALLRAAVAAAGARRPLVVGDRLDTDIEGARRAGLDSLLVLTGVSRPADLLTAPSWQRPTYVALDLDGLFAPGDPVGTSGGSGWRAHADGAVLILEGEGSPIDALRALCAAQWAVEPAPGEPVPGEPVPGEPVPGESAGDEAVGFRRAGTGARVPVVGRGAPARAALDQLGLLSSEPARSRAAAGTGPGRHSGA